MARFEELRQAAHQMLDQVTSEEGLMTVMQEIAKVRPVFQATEREELAVTVGRKSVEEGRFISLEEYKIKAEKRHQERLQRYIERSGNQ